MNTTNNQTSGTVSGWQVLGVFVSGALLALGTLTLAFGLPDVSVVGAQTIREKKAATANETATGSVDESTGEENAMTVSVNVIGPDGKLTGSVPMAKVERSDEEWRQRLTPEQFAILRGKGTERPFCGTLLDNKKTGYYVCVGCRLPLFHSNAKFDSGTGWPSFFQPVSGENVAEHQDLSHGMVRTEILCARCDGHLGHVFEDGPRDKTGLRFCLNSESLDFVEEKDVLTLAENVPALATPGVTPKAGDRLPAPVKDIALSAESAVARAVFAGGCFWCTEAVFEEIEGVSGVVSGYAGGDPLRADYESVCTGTTGHAEVIEITYDSSKVTYGQLLRIFFATHDPTQLNRQGPDSGTQYRSAVFYSDDEQKAAAESYIQQLSEAGAFKKPIVTTLEPLEEFFPAEEYHQDYAGNNPANPYIQMYAAPKVEKVKKMFGDHVKSAASPENRTP